MKAILQRVRSASVTVEDVVIGEIGHGLLVLAGWAPGDTESDNRWIASKIVQMRIFPDENGQMNRSLGDVQGHILVISQFTLFAATKKGNRPGFTLAAPPAEANWLYDHFLSTLSELHPHRIASGRFGADMLIRCDNYGPVTIPIDTQNKI